MLGQLIDMFLEDAQTQISALTEAVQHGDAPAIYRVAHRLRGGSANLGADVLARHCAELEALGRAGTIAGADALLAAIVAEHERVRQALEAERQLA